jgi:hypothetical protein
MSKKYRLVLVGYNSNNKTLESEQMSFIVGGNVADAAESIREHFNWTDVILVSLTELEPSIA